MSMYITAQHQKLLRAKISLALLEELQRRPTDEELHRFIRVLLKALNGLSLTTTAVAKGATA